MSTFEYPWEYNFPPFFTIQPNSVTRSQQLRAWRSLILGYCTFHKIHSLAFNDSLLNLPLFNNTSINRSLTKESLKVILNDLEAEGLLKWSDGKQEFFIYWKTPEEWADLIHKHVSESGLKNSVCTFYELTEADEVRHLPFYQLHQDILKKALHVLEKRGQATIITMADSEGVKFLK